MQIFITDSATFTKMIQEKFVASYLDISLRHEQH